MFNLHDLNKIQEAAKAVQENQNKIEQKKLEILQRIEVKLDRILEALKK